MFETLVQFLKQASDIATLQKMLAAAFKATLPAHAHIAMHHALQCLEVMVNEGWVTGKLDKKKPRLTLTTPNEGHIVHPNRDSAA